MDVKERKESAKHWKESVKHCEACDNAILKLSITLSKRDCNKIKE